MSFLLRGIMTCGLILVLAGVARSGELIVDQKHPQADDKNPGMEDRPFKTIQPAVDAAKPGDKIWIKQGGYEGFVMIAKSGTREKPITLSAWKDDHVQIGYVPRSLPVEGEWAPVKGSKSYQIRLKQDVPEDFLVLLNDKAILTWNQDTPPKDEKVNWAAYRKSDRTLMFNAGGKNPSTLGKFEYGRKLRTPSAAQFALEVADYWIIRKLEFSHTTDGLWLHATSHCVVEDCFFNRCYRIALFMPGSDKTIIRRCNFYRCGCGVSGGGIANIIEDNLLVECGMQPEEDIGAAIFPGYHNSEGGSPFMLKGNMLALQFLHNTVSDNAGAGWWADCPNIQSCRLVGNAFWDNYGGGVYNEDKVNDTITQGNCFYRNGAGSRVSTRWNVIDNLFFEGGVTWAEIDENPLRDGYMLLRNNAFIHPPQGYLSDFAINWGQTAYPEAFRNCIVDRNRIWATPGDVLINDGGTGRKYKTLDDVRKEFQWELHGQVLPYAKEKDTVESVVKAMGGSVVTYRVPWGKHSSEARPMLANAHAWTRWPGAPLSNNPATLPNYFWRVADGQYDCDAMNNGWGRELFHSCWQPESIDSPDGQPAGERLGCRWYCDLEGKFPAGIEDKTVFCKGQLHIWGWRVGLSEGVAWLVMEGLHPEQMLPQGVGYWSPCLAAAPGAEITVSLKMRGKKLASDDKGSPVVWLQFTNSTGQHRQRVFLVGKDDQGKVRRPELTNGSYDWKKITSTITAPEGAVRMALFLGMRPARGRSISMTSTSRRSLSRRPCGNRQSCRFSGSRRDSSWTFRSWGLDNHVLSQPDLAFRKPPTVVANTALEWPYCLAGRAHRNGFVSENGAGLTFRTCSQDV